MSTQTNTTDYELIRETILKVKIEKGEIWKLFFLEKLFLCKIKHSFVITKACIRG